MKAGLFLLHVWLLAAALVSLSAASTETYLELDEDVGSGDFYEDDEDLSDLIDDDDLSEPVVPTRVVPNLRTPVVHEDIKDGSSTQQNVPMPDLESSQRTDDAIYIEDGSGHDSMYTPPALSPSHGDNSRLAPSPPSFSTPLPPQPPYHRGPERPENPITTSKISNLAPVLKRKLKKVPVTAGRSLRWKIPEDTFWDAEEGSTSKLRLTLRNEDGSRINPVDLNWLSFDEKAQVLYLLPVDENDIGRWRFQVIAYDRQGQSAHDTLEIVVRQFSGSRLVNHQLQIHFSFANWNAKVTETWKWKFLDTIRRFYHDASPEHIIVRRATENPFSFAWTNSSLVQHQCRKEEILKLFEALTGRQTTEEDVERQQQEQEHPPSGELKAFFGEEIVLKSVKLNYFGACLDYLYPEQNPTSDNNVPVVRNPIDVINITAGEYLQFKVPKDTCYDEEDGETTRLSLQLLTMNRKELSSNSWLYFDSRNQEFIGIPLGEEVGREEYQLVCSDQNGLSVIDGIEIVVLNRPFSERFGVEFHFQFSSGDRISERRVMLVELISSFFGDSTPANVILKSVDTQTAVWYNKTLAYAPCDDPHALYMKKRLEKMGAKTGSLNLAADKDYPRDGAKTWKSTLHTSLVEHFKPLSLLSVAVVPRGSCIRTTAFPPVVPKDGDSEGNGHIFHGLIPSVDYLMTFFVPALIITFMLLLALVLACLLHKKRKAGKLNLFYSETLPPRVPVILQDELVDEPYGPGVVGDGDVLRKSTLLHGRPPGDRDPSEAAASGGEWDAFIPSEASSLARPTPTYHR